MTRFITFLSIVIVSALSFESSGKKNQLKMLWMATKSAQQLPTIPRPQINIPSINQIPRQIRISDEKLHTGQNIKKMPKQVLLALISTQPLKPCTAADEPLQRKLSKKQYETLRKNIESGECDSRPNTLLFAGNYAPAYGDSAFSDLCFEKAKSAYLTVATLQPFVKGGLSRCRDRIPELLQYMAERDLMSLADSNFCASDSSILYNAAVMTEWAENYAPTLTPLTKLYALNLFDAPSQNALLQEALKAYADSSLRLQAPTLNLITDCYLQSTSELIDSTLKENPELSSALFDDFVKTASNPRISPIVESRLDRLMCSAYMSMKSGNEEQYNKFMDLATSVNSSEFNHEAENMRRNIMYHLWDNVLPKPEADPSELATYVRMFCSTLSADKNSDLNQQSGLDDLFYNIYYSLSDNHGHNALMQEIVKCDECSNLGHLLVALSDYLTNQTNDLTECVDHDYLNGLMYHYFKYMFDPAADQHVQAVSDALDKAVKEASPENEAFRLYASLVLSDMKAKTLENPKEALKTLKPFKNLFEKNPEIMPDVLHDYLNYMSLLYNAVGDTKKSNQYAAKALEMKCDK